jgi:stage IV sporulation protein FB
MGWEDRDYYRDQSRGATNPLTWIFTGSVPLFTVFGIRVRAHASLLLIVVLVLLFGFGHGRTPVEVRVQSMTMLFLVILLHEFGHCFAARWTGGSANEIIMTPLGGLAMAMAVRRPWPTFVTVAGGPLVNVIICIFCGLGLYLIEGIWPLGPWSLGEAYREVSSPGWFQVASYLFWFYSISYGLLLFNLLPVFPLDGGQLLQSILWKPMGYYKSMILTLNIGLVGSVLMMMVGIASFGSVFGGLLLMLIGLSCFMNCFRMRAMMKAEGPWAFSDEDTMRYDDGAYATETKTRRKKNDRAEKRLKKLRETETSEQEKIDAILAKVSATGMQSLTWLEKRALHKATEAQRQRDLEMKKLRR